MSYKAMEHIRDMLCDELDDMVETDKYDLEKIKMITSSIKNIDTIEAMNEGSDNYSRYSTRSRSIRHRN